MSSSRPISGPLRRRSGTGLHRRQVLLATCLIGLAGCGFRPLYGETEFLGEASTHLARIEVESIPDRSGQIMRNYLLERLNAGGRPDRPLYRLEVTLSEVEQELGILKDDTATRANLRITAVMVLRPADASNELLRRQLLTITSFNILEDEFATISSERDARDRALRQLSEDVRTQLALYFQRVA